MFVLWACALGALTVPGKGYRQSSEPSGPHYPQGCSATGTSDLESSLQFFLPQWVSSPIFKAALPWSLRPIAWLVPSVPHLQLRWASSLPEPVTLSPCRLQCHPRKPVLRAAWGAENTPSCLLLCVLIVVSSSVELHVALMLGPASLGKQPWSVQHPAGKTLPSVFPHSFSTEMSGLCCAGLGPLWGCLMLGHPGGGGRRGCACCYGNTLLRSWTYFICRQFQDESISSPTPSLLLLLRVSPQPSVIFPPPHSTSDILLAERPLPAIYIATDATMANFLMFLLDQQL